MNSASKNAKPASSDERAKADQSPVNEPSPPPPPPHTQTQSQPQIQQPPQSQQKREKKRPALYAEALPTFYVGAGNNSELIIDIMKRMGWEQIFEANDDSYKLKWVQCNRSINWNTFKEGEQMVNHVPNCSLFTNKLNLLCSLQAYEKTQLQNTNKAADFLSLDEYVPLTYKLDDKMDKETYFATAKPDELWICKPVSLNQGKGIYLVRSPEILRQKLELNDDGQQRRFGIRKPHGRIIQKYISNPLLINKKKFDIRCYMLIASTKPLLVFFHHGYLRLSMNEFDNKDSNLITHLTNQYFQKKDPQYKDIKEETIWSMEQFNTYINEEVAPIKDLPKDWVNNQLTKRINQIMLQVVHSVRFKIQRKMGYFGIYGYDFMIDEDMKVWLLEINVNPAITTNTETLVKVIPSAIEEGIHIAHECFTKIKTGKKIWPLKAMNKYSVLFNELSIPAVKSSIAMSPLNVRRTISLSPNAPQTPGTSSTNAGAASASIAQLSSQPQNRTQANSNDNTINSVDGIYKFTKPISLNENRSKTDLLIHRNFFSNSHHHHHNHNHHHHHQNNPHNQHGNARDAQLVSKRSTFLSENTSASLDMPSKFHGDLPKIPTELSIPKVQPDFTKTTFEYTKFKSNSQKMNSLSFKPATVEVFFRSSSGKTQKIGNKPLHSVSFPSKLSISTKS